MSPSRPTHTEIKCSLLWKLCRRHGWATPIPKQQLVTVALEDTEQGRGKRLVEELLEEPYIEFQRGVGYTIKNDPDSQARAAFRLRETCSYSTLQIETTLSRFEQAGGFAQYVQPPHLESADTW